MYSLKKIGQNLGDSALSLFRHNFDYAGPQKLFPRLQVSDHVLNLLHKSWVAEIQSVIRFSSWGFLKLHKTVFEISLCFIMLYELCVNKKRKRYPSEVSRDNRSNHPNHVAKS